MSNLYKGKTIEQWIDTLYRKIVEIQLNKNAKEAIINAASIEFNSERFRSKNVADALNESRGIVLGQLDLLEMRYSNTLTVRELLSELKEKDNYSFNEAIIAQLDDVHQVESISNAINELLKLILHLNMKVSALTSKINAIEVNKNELL